MIYKTDYHVHTLYSDGKAPPEEYISSALSNGLKEIGFAEHLTLYTENPQLNIAFANVPAYITHLKKLKKNSKNITVRIGLEVDFFPGKEKEIYELIRNFDLDYVIGSVHFIGEKTVDSGPEYFKGKNIDTLYKTYFEYVTQSVSSGLFDIIAHCDLIRIYNIQPSLNPEPLYRQLAIDMKKHDVVLEINTNGRNKPIGDFYPDRRFLHYFFKENVPVCVNSDAHFPSRIGQYFDEAYQFIKDVGYKEMAVFQNRERSIIPIDL
jgi:histidinol-phosphatase (PHP family)